MDWQKSFGIRFLLLIPIAFCLFLLLDSQDRMVRLGAVVLLVILAQAREWLMAQSMRSLAKGGKS
ncbi:MAG: hypothetical protein QW568_02490 [Candidatus Anstonellaceae archaeon]